MEYNDLIKERYSCRCFDGTPVPQDKLQKILEAGRIAPTGHNGQPQRILVLNDPESIAKMEGCTPCHYGAQTALICCYEKTGEPTVHEDAAIVMTHMMLECTNEGVDNVWIRMFQVGGLREHFNIPQNYSVLGILMMGKAVKGIKPAKMHWDKKALEETVFYGKF